MATASSQAASQPAATGSAATSVILPLGLLPIEVTDANGNPLAGATVTAKVAEPNLPADQTCNDNVTYTLPTTGPDGVSNVAAMYETYTLTVKRGSNTATVTVKLTPTGTTATYPSPDGRRRAAPARRGSAVSVRRRRTWSRSFPKPVAPNNLKSPPTRCRAARRRGRLHPGRSPPSPWRSSQYYSRWPFRLSTPCFEPPST